MTIAISMKVNDGIVLATDSASTMMAQDMNGNLGVVNIYDNANKLINVHKSLPVGIITWGAGSMGNESTSTVIKEFRKSIDNGNILIDFDNYSLEELSIKFKDFVLEKYNREFSTWPVKPDIGFVVAGYPKNVNSASEWLIEINNGQCTGPIKLRPDNEAGASWFGQPEAITRIFNGYSPVIQDILFKRGVVNQSNYQSVMSDIHSNCSAQLITPAMPIKDAIDLAEFLVDLTEKYVRFAPGPKTVGGPIEIASITAHEGFKWIKRKHYYEKGLNN